MKKSMVLMGTCMLAGCVDLSPVKPGSTGGNSLTGEEEQVTRSEDDYKTDIATDKEKQTERANQLMNLISAYYSKMSKAEMDITNETKWNDQTLTTKSKTQEKYQDGAIKGYYVVDETKAADETVKQEYYYNGDKYFLNVNQTAWQELKGSTKTPTIYLYLVKLMLEGNDLVDVEEGLSQLHMRKTVTDASLIESIYQYVDFPMMLTPNAQKKVTLDYQIDETNGAITVATLTLETKDLGQTMQHKVNIRTNTNAEFADWKIDTAAKFAGVDTESSEFAKYFKAMNPTKAFTYFETYTNIINGDDVKATLSLGNYLAGVPYMAVEGTVKDSELKDARLIAQQKRYTMKDGKVNSSDAVVANHYTYFVNRVLEKYDALNKLESEEESEVYALRELFENDVESFKAAAGKADVSHLIREGEAVYGIDYRIDKKTQQLVSVYLWATTPGEEKVSTLTTLNFSRFNAVNPNLVLGNIDKKFWEALN
ncbi:hypothetical protein I4Q36_01755 [Tuanshanicoccus lijuaniae]|uniref:hypothetical protein n=1 Tax=Aerococcaceae bacterium zg-1292 TaxID=2774330 RepID=UPI0019355282|nr:hypothetical protein [Aerococcaceae bacterium zg-1292]MBF6625109.1 hypothetical protein [Aerococcaceae bacterium zg-BR9]MBF6978237.1 hypothetical protein [Aerococcaceae bacterium zg-BR22]QQA37467.1 hypothetical protein I4Q36_01755 [Aerococcaceae bacterium zg-1292]